MAGPYWLLGVPVVPVRTEAGCQAVHQGGHLDAVSPVGGEVVDGNSGHLLLHPVEQPLLRGFVLNVTAEVGY